MKKRIGEKVNLKVWNRIYRKIQHKIIDNVDWEVNTLYLKMDDSISWKIKNIISYKVHWKIRDKIYEEVRWKIRNKIKWMIKNKLYYKIITKFKG